jgi:homoserine/homoserine lactone efflux protein
LSAEAWAVFALFWVLFVTTPGPNAVNCIGNGMGVAGILTQATLFLLLSAAGVTALLAASPGAFFRAKLAGAAVPIWLGVRGWVAAARPVAAGEVQARSICGRAFPVTTFNAKSVAGYLAAFTQFVEPGVPIGEQMILIVPTALAITAVSYTGYTAIGAGLGRLTMGAKLNLWFRRSMSAAFMIYGLLLGSTALPGRT